MVLLVIGLFMVAVAYPCGMWVEHGLAMRIGSPEAVATSVFVLALGAFAVGVAVA